MARTIKLYRIEADGRHLSAGAIRVSSDRQWRLFLATAALVDPYPLDLNDRS